MKFTLAPMRLMFRSNIPRPWYISDSVHISCGMTQYISRELSNMYYTVSIALLTLEDSKERHTTLHSMTDLIWVVKLCKPSDGHKYLLVSSCVDHSSPLLRE
jgi:hypothetical protein